MLVEIQFTVRTPDGYDTTEIASFFDDLLTAQFEEWREHRETHRAKKLPDTKCMKFFGDCELEVLSCEEITLEEPSEEEANQMIQDMLSGNRKKIEIINPIDLSDSEITAVVTAPQELDKYEWQISIHHHDTGVSAGSVVTMDRLELNAHLCQRATEIAEGIPNSPTVHVTGPLQLSVCIGVYTIITIKAQRK